ncbi:dihydrodipicolinate synthase family protein [Microvirga sp. W0021]|uniref:Dihydrodipicolinate synthase family protein n=1 Tax=Hohaiivirga grylli TaxID=3133970 RepID=A0ABV0BHI6_9HYPH
MIKLHGIIPPVASIVTADGALNPKGMQNMIDALITGGVHGLFFLGSASEVMHMTDKLRQEVLELSVAHTNKRLPVLVGAIGCGTQSVIEYAQAAERAGADGLVLLNPYYSAMPEEALFKHFARIMDKVSIPAVIYNLPMATNQSMSPAFIKRLAMEIPSIIGCKDTVDTFGHLRELLLTIKPERPDFAIFSGFDEYLLDTLLLGGEGCVPASANFAPHLTVGLYEAFQKKDWDSIVKLNRKVGIASKLYTMGPPFYGAMKEAARQAGVDITTDVLAPALPADDKIKQAVKELLAKLQD